MKSFNKILLTHLVILHVSAAQMFAWIYFKKHTAAVTAPCKDFYEYACGNYSLENTETQYSEITQKLDYVFNTKLLHHFQNSWLNYENQTYYDKVGIYLKSCLQNKRGNVFRYFDELRPGVHLNWPLLETKGQWLKENERLDLWTLLGHLQSYGLNSVIVKQETLRNKDNSLDILLSPADIGLMGSLPEDNLITLILQRLGVKDTEIILPQIKSIDFKLRDILANTTLTNNMREPQYMELKYKDLSSSYPHLQLFLKALLGKELEHLSTIGVENLEYFDSLYQQSWSVEDLEQLCNYLMLKFLLYLSLDGKPGLEPLECAKDLRNKFDLAVNYIAYNSFFIFPDRFKTELSNLESKLRKSIEYYFINNYLSLSSKQMQYLKAKLKAVRINIGNLPSKSTNETVQEFYSDMASLDPHNYYKNHLILLQHRFRNALKYIQNQTHFIVTDNHLGEQSAPFFVVQQNMIFIPIASFQEPFFYLSQTSLKKTSLFGFVLAHEFAHAFDLNSLTYDSQEGITTNVNFARALSCMQHPEPTAEINERMADLFGLFVAYKSYFDDRYFYRADGKQFFLNLAQFFCNKKKLQFIGHDSDKIRLNFMVKNFPPFSEIFRCPIESPMNIKNKCRLY